ncbi:hypothetical protein [Bradyrhizobium sp. STM 3562]|uniref:hypothetical protein n=1 Tax=Bradyrhizobium sp. STM 3562 TaxID=578924 RepID=UPI00388D3A4F
MSDHYDVSGLQNGRQPLRLGESSLDLGRPRTLATAAASPTSQGVFSPQPDREQINAARHARLRGQVVGINQIHLQPRPTDPGRSGAATVLQNTGDFLQNNCGEKAKKLCKSTSRTWRNW